MGKKPKKNFKGSLIIKPTKDQALPIIIIALLVGGVLILVHQVIEYGVLFNPDDFFHHENISLVIIAFALGLTVPLLLVYQKKKRKQAHK